MTANAKTPPSTSGATSPEASISSLRAPSKPGRPSTFNAPGRTGVTPPGSGSVGPTPCPTTLSCGAFSSNTQTRWLDRATQGHRFPAHGTRSGSLNSCPLAIHHDGQGTRKSAARDGYAPTTTISTPGPTSSSTPRAGHSATSIFRAHSEAGDRNDAERSPQYPRPRRPNRDGRQPAPVRHPRRRQPGRLAGDRSRSRDHSDRVRVRMGIRTRGHDQHSRSLAASAYLLSEPTSNLRICATWQKHSLSAP